MTIFNSNLIIKNIYYDKLNYINTKFLSYKFNKKYEFLNIVLKIELGVKNSKKNVQILLIIN